MLRNAFKKRTRRSTPDFRLRGLDNTRIESLSDGVFAIAIGLLLISTDVPATFGELESFLDDFIPFGATIGLLMVVWYQHYLFFVRYGLTDAFTVFLNTVFLFLILFYVYPLKFLLQVLYQLFYGLFSRDRELIRTLFEETMPLAETPRLMIIYGLGAGSLFLLLVFFYLYAYRNRQALRLSPFEDLETRGSVTTNLLMAAIPLLSAGIAWTGWGGDHNFTLSGLIYWLYPVVMPLHARWHNRKKRAWARSR